MSGEKNQERILGSLLESSKTTADLASELGYIDPEGYGDYKIILRDLKKLEENGYIEGKKIKLHKAGPMPTSYSIILNTQNLKSILKKYKNLIYKMQKTPFILESILEANTDDTVSLEVKEDLKKMLQSSPSFFEYLFLDEDSEISTYIEKVADIYKGEKNYELFISREEISIDKVYTEEIYRVVVGINVVFRACVDKDLVKGCSSADAKEYIKETINKPSAAVFKIVLEHYSDKKDLLDLRGKRIISLKTPKLHEVFQQNLKALNREQN